MRNRLHGNSHGPPDTKLLPSGSFLHLHQSGSTALSDVYKRQTYIYADARKGGLTPELRPLSAIIFVVVLALLIAINYRAGKAKKKD